MGFLISHYISETFIYISFYERFRFNEAQGMKYPFLSYVKLHIHDHSDMKTVGIWLIIVLLPTPSAFMLCMTSDAHRCLVQKYATHILGPSYLQKPKTKLFLPYHSSFYP